MKSENVILSHRFRDSAPNCWICEKWNCVKIAWTPREMGWSGRFLERFSMKSNKVEPVYGHFEIDGYEPCFMEKDVDSQEYEIIRAVPPNV